MPNKSRDWPLTERERQLAGRAFRMTRPAMKRYRLKYPDLIDEIEGEFDRRVCCCIQSYDPRKFKFRQWVFTTLRFSVQEAIKHRGQKNEPIDARVEVEAIIAPAHVPDVWEYCCQLDPVAKDVVVLLARGMSLRMIERRVHRERLTIKRMISESHSSIRESLERVSA